MTYCKPTLLESGVSLQCMSPEVAHGGHQPQLIPLIDTNRYVNSP